MSLEPQIDQLYQLPLSAFTAARNALAKTVKGADAKRIKQLPKPTVVPWTVNQLYWHARKAYDRVLAAGQALRQAQIDALKGRGADVRQTTEAHRAAVAAAVREATALAAKEGAHPLADQLARMLEALSLAKDLPEGPGRLTEVIGPSGFEALAGIAPAGAFRGAASSAAPGRKTADAAPSGPRLVSSRPAAPREDPAEARRRAAEERRREAEERRQAKEAAAARAKAEARVAAAERELAEMQKTLERAEREAADARRAVEDAERKLATARADPMLRSPHV